MCFIRGNTFNHVEFKGSVLAKQLCCTQLLGAKTLRWRLPSAGCWMVCWEGLVLLVG